MTQQFPFWVYIKKKSKTLPQKSIITFMFIVSIIFNSQHMEATQVPIKRGVNKKEVVQWTITQPLEKEILLFATALMDLEGIMPSKISLTKKYKCHMMSFICVI